MSLLTQKSQIDLDLAAKDLSVLRSLEALHHSAAVLAAENKAFWSIPTDRLLAVLNADIAQTLATFAANTAAGTAINALLEQVALPQFPQRAPVVPGRTDVVFDQDPGLFVFVPPPEPEVEPEPEPIEEP